MRPLGGSHMAAPKRLGWWLPGDRPPLTPTPPQKPLEGGQMATPPHEAKKATHWGSSPPPPPPEGVHLAVPREGVHLAIPSGPICLRSSDIVLYVWELIPHAHFYYNLTLYMLSL